MPDGQYAASFQPDSMPALAPDGYCPPVALILSGLETTELALATGKVSVSAMFLRFLISEIARSMPFDPDFYAAAYPDVEAARLAGDVPSLHHHFVEQGYFERRQPGAMPFDPTYYATQYDDLAQVFDRHDIRSLHAHFVGHGWQEGRAGVAWHRPDAERWVTAARAGDG